MAKTTTKKTVDGLSYEEAFTELGEIVVALEGGQHPLDEALVLFERGQVLARHCGKLLEQAELKVRQLSDEGQDELADEQDG